MFLWLVFCNDTPTTEIDTYGHTLSLHDALPIWADWSPAGRRDRLVGYIGFPFWDVLTFTITNWRDLGEFNEIRIDRISPEDAVAIRKGNTLKGVNLGRFGGFFSRAHRENDYLDRKSTRLNSSH